MCLMSAEIRMPVCVRYVRSYLMEVPTKSMTEVPKYCNAKASHKKELVFDVCYGLVYCFAVCFSFKESKKNNLFFFYASDKYFENTKMSCENIL